MFIYVIILDRDNTVSVYQYIGHDHCREEIQQRHPFLTNDLIWGFNVHHARK